MKVIAHIENDFDEKFGVPRQAGLVPECLSRIVFEPEYRDESALRGLEGFSHIWLIWNFSLSERDDWSPTVRPPRLGGNERMGVFATRSPFRPNPIGLSCVKLLEICRDTQLGPTLIVSGADLMSGTPIYDIKPYLPYADCVPNATGGFTANELPRRYDVIAADEVWDVFPADKRQALTGVLSQRPIPSYQSDPERIYKMSYAGYTVEFCVLPNLIEIKRIVKEL
ncbi:MAG: tRNA (N6-threonylcarbamoyladenosine(37)-N6)-methyltransferase TrmO [Lachnospiraceae bacterium]|nr:tRNA (N6-threonylcarbamoyladenosine(37)-N6)-methyltransferase TrmO [Candidatus Minthocola equi]